MSIEFRCASCGQLLRVPDEAIGKVARCPACQTEQAVIPSAPLAAPSDEVNPYAAPLTLPRPTAAAPGLQPIVPTPLEVGHCFSAAWNIYLENVGMCIAVYLAAEFISQAPGFLMQMVGAAAQGARDAEVVLAALVIPLWIAAMVLSLWLTAGRILFFVKTERGASPEFVELFRGWFGVGRLFLLALILGGVVLAMIAVAAALLAVLAAARALEIAGIVLIPLGFVGVAVYVYVLLRYGMSVFLVIDRNLPVGEALRTSAQITQGNAASLFLLGMLSTLLNIAGMLACCVGVLFTVPLSLMILTVAYLQMSGQTLARAATRG
ncbi:MAG: zinc-ribbon domain-containing protein [Pirellulales bacterium]|nr:zinc-ribbon domain-containing protein [Pirellulales bacterium]